MYFFLLDLRVLDRGYRDYWEHLVPEIRERGLLGERKEVASDQEAMQEITRIIKQKRFQTVVVVGGDALLACVASVAAGSGLALGYVPLGDLCAFGHRWAISSQVGEVGDSLAARRLREVDLLKIGRSFIIDHFRVGRAIDPTSDNRSSRSLMVALKELLHRSRDRSAPSGPEEFRVIVEREGLEAYLISVGMMIEINRSVQTIGKQEEHFALVSCAARSRKNLPWEQMREDPIAVLPEVTRLHLSDCTVTFDRPVPVMLDGYRAELSGQVQFKLVPAQVKLIV